jgi:hypothetical protein
MKERAHLTFQISPIDLIRMTTITRGTATRRSHSQSVPISCRGQQEKEDDADPGPGRHLEQDLGKGYEGEPRTGARIASEGEDGRDHEDEIDEEENRPAVLTGHIGEAPDVAEADGGADRCQDEACPGTPLLLHRTS